MYPAKARTAQKTARLCSAEILNVFFVQKKAVKPIFDNHVLRAHLPARDRNLTKELVYGTLRKKEDLDTILARLSHTPLKKMDSLLYSVLLVGLYQIFFLDRIPDSAAVNEAVASCKAQKKSPPARKLYGFVNGVLRQATRKKEEIYSAISNQKPRANHPLWLTERWQQRFGKEETARICAVNNTPPLLILRINSAHITKEEFYRQLEEASIPWINAQFAPDAVILPEGAEISLIPGYREGHFQVQDQAAQLASLLLAPFDSPRLRLLDACAGVGGKTSHILQCIAPDAEVHAIEPEPFRMTRLQKMQQQYNATSLRLHQQDLLSFSPHRLFDRILVDAPCSGSGVLRRNPDIRWSRKVEEILFFQKKQLALLDHAASLAAPGAIVVYATCSIEKEENEDVITQFLTRHEEFTLSSPTPFLPPSAQEFIHNNFFAPHPEEEIDGFFAVRLEKK